MALESIGTVHGLWTFPVKSMKGARQEQAMLTEHGFLGDRAYALVDRETGKVVSAKSVRLFPDILHCRATYARPPEPDGELSPVTITLPGGDAVSSDADDCDRRLSDFFGREMTLASAAPGDFTIDMYHPDIEDADPRGFRNTEVEQKLGSALFAESGAPSPVRPESFFDVFPVTLITTSTLDRLRELQPKSDFDVRRFRMNLIVETNTIGFVENNWLDRVLAIGDEVRLRVTKPDARCVMTTLAQDELPQDVEILRTLVRHNRLQVAEGASFPCAGVYAVVGSAGRVRAGDSVSLA